MPPRKAASASAPRACPTSRRAASSARPLPPVLDTTPAAAAAAAATSTPPPPPSRPASFPDPGSHHASPPAARPEAPAPRSRKRPAQDSEADLAGEEETLRYTAQVQRRTELGSAPSQQPPALLHDGPDPTPQIAVQPAPAFLGTRVSSFFTALRPARVIGRVRGICGRALALFRQRPSSEQYDVVQTRRSTPAGLTVKRFKRLPGKHRSYRHSGHRNTLPLHYLSELPAFSWTKDALGHIGHAELQAIINFLEYSVSEIHAGRVKNIGSRTGYLLRDEVEPSLAAAGGAVNLPLTVTIHNYMIYKYEKNSYTDFLRTLNDWLVACNGTRLRIYWFYDDENIESLKISGIQPGDRFSLPGTRGHENEARMHVRQSAEFLNFILKHQPAFPTHHFSPEALAKVIVDFDAIHKQELPVSFFDWPSKRHQSTPGDFPEDDVFFDDIAVEDLQVEDLWEYRYPSRDFAPRHPEDLAATSPPPSPTANTLVYRGRRAYPARGILKQPKRLQHARDMKRLLAQPLGPTTAPALAAPGAPATPGPSRVFRVPSPTPSEDSSLEEVEQGSPMDIDSPTKIQGPHTIPSTPWASDPQPLSPADEEERTLNLSIEAAVTMAQRNVGLGAPSPKRPADPAAAGQDQSPEGHAASGAPAQDNSTPTKSRRRVAFISPVVVYKPPTRRPSHKLPPSDGEDAKQNRGEAPPPETPTGQKTYRLRRLLLEQREQGLRPKSLGSATEHHPPGCAEEDSGALSSHCAREVSRLSEGGSGHPSPDGAPDSQAAEATDAQSHSPALEDRATPSSEDPNELGIGKAAVSGNGDGEKAAPPKTPTRSLDQALAAFWSPDDSGRPFGVADVDDMLMPSFSELRISSEKADDLECQRQLQSELLEQTRRETAARKAEEERRKAEEEQLARTGGLRASRQPVVPPMDAQWRAKVMATIAARANIELAKTPEGSPLHRHDFETVVHPTEWLNDEIVNSALIYLASYINQKAGIKNLKVATDTPKCVAFNSFVSTRLVNGADITERTLRRAGVRKDNFLDIDTILFPICQHNHWTLAVVRPSKRTVAHMDSLRRRGAGSREVTAKAMKWVQKTLGDKFVEAEWKVVDHESPQQTNGHDCGVHAVTNAMCVALSLDPLSYEASEMPLQRLRLAAVLLNNGYKDEFDLGGL